MIRKIQINNFQGHKSTKIQLAKGITVFIGNTNAGKSAIIRAIRWVLQNKPSGNKFIRKGTNAVEVTVDAVTHKRTKSKNMYIVDSTEYKAIGTSVPSEVQEKLNISTCAITTQFDPPFLIHKWTPREVSAKFAELLNIGKYLDIIHILLKDIRKLKNVCTYLQECIDKLSKVANTYYYIDDADTDLTKLEKTYRKLKNEQKRLSTIQTVVECVIKRQNELNSIPDVRTAFTKCGKYVKQCEALLTEYKTIYNIKQVLHTIESLNSIIAYNEDSLYKEAQSYLEQVEHICNIQNVLHNIQMYTSTIDTLKKKEQNLLTTKKELLKNKCPLCGSSIK